MADTDAENGIEASFMDPAVQDDPFATYAEMHERCPVYRLPETGLVMVTKYDDVRTVMTDSSVFSSQPSGGAGRQTDIVKAHADYIATHGWVKARTLQRTDPPVHTRYRKLLGRVFTNRRVKDMAPRIDEITHMLVDQFIDRGNCEWVSEMALPLPGIFIAEQLGLEASQIDVFKRWADAMLAMSQRVLTLDEALQAAATEVEAQQFMAKEFEKRRANPTDDLISALVHAHGEDEEPFTMEELQDLMHQLITGGFETTTAALSTGMWLLLRYPDQQQAIRNDPSLISNFIEESLRFDSPVAGLWRVAACPTSIRGVDIEAGQPVMARYAAANRDADQFQDPDRFDIMRSNATSHVAFGVGNHFCIGAALARQELLSVFQAVVARMDDLALAEPLDEQPHEFSFFLRPMKQLQLSFRAKGGPP
ncbi:MAG: cytochrome P450 [Acidimicrobiales bacterium]|jgi:cytochrome P450